MNTITIIALVLIFCGGIGAILLTIGQTVSSAKNKNEIINITKDENIKLKNDLAEIKEERNELSKALTKRDSALEEKNNKIIELNQQLVQKSEYIQNYLTGGKGYPVLFIESFATNNYSELKGLFKLSIVSKFPIYNLIINVYDYDLLINGLKTESFDKNPVLTMNNFKKSRILEYKIDELSPNQSTYFGNEIKLGEARYFIQIKARNDVFIEKVASIISETILSFGYQVYTLDGKLMEQGFGDNTSEDIRSKLIQKLNSIPLTTNFDMME